MNHRLVAELKKIIEDVKRNNKNIRIDGYIKSKNSTRIKEGKSNVEINLNVDYGDLLKESSQKLKQVGDDKIRSVASKYNVAVPVVEEQLDTVRKQIDGRIERYEPQSNDPDDGYVYLGSNTKIKTETGDIYFTGITERENTIIQAEYKPSNKRLKTKIKDEFRKELPLNDLKTYKLEPKEFYKLKVV